MEVNYQKTVQLDTDVHSFKEKLDEFISNLIKYTLKRDPSSIKLGLIKNNNCIIDENFYNVFNQEYDSFNVKLLKFKEKLDELSNLFKENQDIFPYEYYDCLEINAMIKYTLKRDPSSIKPEDLKFVRDVSDPFFDITSTKLELIKNNNCIIDENFYNVFNQEYDSFNVKLLKFKEYFYSNIYQESYDEQDVIDYLEVAWE